MSEPYIKDGALYQKGVMFASETGTENLRQFFLAERDKELGRWRSEASPTWVGYSQGGDRAVLISETTGEVVTLRRGHVFPRSSLLSALSEEYFADHPEPKPWHTAKPGEVWRVTYRTPRANETANPVMTCVMDGPNVSFFNEWRLHTVHYTGIESAERIWPES